MNQRSGLYGANQDRSPGGASRVGSAGLLDQRGSNATRDVRHGLLAAMVGGVLLSSLQAQELSRLELLARIDAVVEQAMADGPLAGVSIGVRHGGETIVAKGYGYADLENDVRATEHTVYRIVSITKQFTATAIMMLVEDGKLSLDDELTTFLPDYPANDNTVTVRHLLNHTSGIKSYTGLGRMWQEKMTLALSHEELIALFADEPFDFPPGEQYRYNNSGYYLLGVIIEKVTDQSYAEVLRERVWDPLAMLESHYLYNAPIVRHRAEGYKVEAGALLNDDPLSMLQPFSAGALGSSVHDMLTWLQAFHERRVVSDDSYRQMTTPWTLNNGEALGYGFGLAVGDFEDHPVISHGGGINGFTTHSSYYPDDDIAIVVLCNTPTNTGRVERRIARLMLGIPETAVQDLELDAAAMDAYVGEYQLGPLVLRVYLDDAQLMSQATGQPAFRLRAQGDHVFVPTFDDEVHLTFEVADGRAARVILRQGGGEIQGERIDP